jgi:hypothetical protein
MSFHYHGVESKGGREKKMRAGVRRDGEREKERERQRETQREREGERENEHGSKRKMNRLSMHVKRSEIWPQSPLFRSSV